LKKDKNVCIIIKMNKHEHLGAIPMPKDPTTFKQKEILKTQLSLKESSSDKRGDEKEKRYWQGKTSKGNSWEIFCGDAISVLKDMPDNKFDCVVTSPPYYSLRDYGIAGQIGLEETVSEYVQRIAGVMDEVFRVLAPKGLVFLNLGDTYYSGKGKSHGIDRKSNKRRFGLRPVDKSGGIGAGIPRKSAIGVPWRVAIEMIQKDRILRSSIIWHRKNSLPEAVKDRPHRSYEYVFMFAKSRFYYFNRKAIRNVIVEEDVWTIPPRPSVTNCIDTAPFPDELVERCLDLGCPPGGSVLDPFAGSGTTLRVALKTGRDATGIDLSNVFCQFMAKEIGKISQCI
jgi:DNA modification methylase